MAQATCSMGAMTSSRHDLVTATQEQQVTRAGTTGFANVTHAVDGGDAVAGGRGSALCGRVLQIDSPLQQFPELPSLDYDECSTCARLARGRRS